MSAVILIGCAQTPPSAVFESDWHDSFDRDWVGPHYWANRLQDWRVRNGRLECTARLPLRTVHLLTRRLGGGTGEFTVSVRLGTIDSAAMDTAVSAAGILVGAGPGLDYRAAALIHHSSGKAAGLFAGITTSGRLFLRDLEDGDRVLGWSSDSLTSIRTTALELTAKPAAVGYVIKLSATSNEHRAQTVVLQLDSVPGDRLEGNIALVSHTGDSGTTSFWFQGLRVDGSKLERHDTRTAGPIIGKQHTLSRGTLKLTAQLMPIGPNDSRSVDLQIMQADGWEAVATSAVVVPGYTATFRLEDWDSGRDVSYRLSYTMTGADGTTETFYYDGLIRREPIDKDEIVVAVFTGNHNVSHPGVDQGDFPWDWGLWFPHNDIVQHVSAHRPDLLFFSGDQVYEGASPTRADFEQPYRDYLYKWYLWYWAFGGLTADIPSVSIPDDHDVYHGNVWGAGGAATPPGLTGAAAQDAGGYKLPPEFVNMVQRTQTSHLPDPYDPTPVQQGIAVYYTDIVYAGVSFAVIEDRKFKSAPAPLLPRAEIWNGWPQNPDFGAKTEADLPGASLLGERQLAFLENWASDWSAGAWMKVVLSQTIFANIATLPDSATSGSVIPSLDILAADDYASNEKIVNDFDSNGWPQTGRNKALRAMRKGFAVHLAGDQHLGSTIQYGVEAWGDAAYALCVPSVANFWPRRWYPALPGANRQPDLPRYTGDYEDGFGNKMTVLAISNPHRSGKEPAALHDRAPGYGVARFNRETRTASLEAWPRWADPDIGDGPYPGWPVILDQLDNYGREAVAYLPTLEVTGMTNPVVQVLREETGEIVYSLRIKGTSFKPKVFAEGLYTVRVGEPGTQKLKTMSALEASASPSETLTISFE